jgi:hypothetical protein
LISRSPEQLFVRAPIVVIFEAKNENIKQGIAQCSAAMVAAQRFNELENTGISSVYGAVTTGNIWKFLKLEVTTIYVDKPEYYIDSVDAILGVLLQMVGELELALQ